MHVAQPSIFTHAQITALEGMRYRADDESEAQAQVVAALGIELRPCCTDEPCAECRDDDRLDAEDRIDWAADAERMR